MALNQSHIEPVYIPDTNKPMNIAVFASGGGGNLCAVINLAEKFSQEMKVQLVVSDSLNIPAIDIARANGISVIARGFEKECGSWQDYKSTPELASQYHERAELFHDAILEEIFEHEKMLNVEIDLVILSYHRWIRGKLLRHFDGRMINQHPADLTVMENSHPQQRKYVGLSPVFSALKDGQRQTRTCNFLVRDGQDNGEILCAGPWVSYDGSEPVTKQSAQQHEMRQKEKSDWPCISYVTKAISEGRYAIHTIDRHPDGCHVVLLNQEPLPYGGVDLASDFYSSLT